MSIGELADAAAVSRRAVRFYVQQKLLPAPLGVGRGRHYGAEHLARLRRISELQSTGHSLDEIRRIFSASNTDEPAAAVVGSAAPAKAPPWRRRGRPVVVDATLWTRLRLADGVELHYDAARFAPRPDELATARDAVLRALRVQGDGGRDEKTD